MTQKALQIGMKTLIWLLAMAPIGAMAYRLQLGALGANPVETLIDELGLWAMRILLICLALTPLRWLSGQSHWLQYRRLIGLWAAFYASLHALMYLALELGWDWAALLEDVLQRPYITMGMVALLLLWALAATSYRLAMRKLGARWKRLHEWVYIAATLVILHFAFLAKGDRLEPKVYALILALLLCLRWVKALQANSARTAAST